MLVLSRNKEEGIYIIPKNSNDPIYIKITDIKSSRFGYQVKIGFEADKDNRIIREELLDNDGLSLEDYIKNTKSVYFNNGEGI